MHTDLRYGDVERAMIIAFDIKEKDLGMFCARIRHLRKKAIPGLGTPGTGRQIVWTLDHVRHLYLGLVMNRAGFAPMVIAGWFGRHGNPVAKWFGNASKHADDNFKVAVVLFTFGGEVGETHRPTMLAASGYTTVKAVNKDAVKGESVFDYVYRKTFRDDDDLPITVINISVAERKIQKCLAEVMDERERAHGKSS